MDKPEQTTEKATTCPKCCRPKATPGDVIRWLSGADGYGLVCFDGMAHPRLLPEEDAIPGADLLKKTIARLRKQKDWLVCLFVAGSSKHLGGYGPTPEGFACGQDGVLCNGINSCAACHPDFTWEDPAP